LPSCGTCRQPVNSVENSPHYTALPPWLYNHGGKAVKRIKIKIQNKATKAQTERKRYGGKITEKAALFGSIPGTLKHTRCICQKVIVCEAKQDIDNQR